MSIFEGSNSVWTARLLSLLRIVSGLLFMVHGTMKLFAWPPTEMMREPVQLMTQLGLAGVLEVFGGLAIVLGLFTRPIAFVLAGEMAVAYFQAHHPRSIFPAINQGELAVLYCFIFLYFMMAGAGPWSIDAILARRSGANTRG